MRLSGGNPQIAKGGDDGPVRACIAAMPGWKRDVGRQFDELIERTVPGVHWGVRWGVRWNSPFYGVEDRGWCMAHHGFTRYVKLTFLRGRSPRPMPPVDSKDPHARYLHVHEGESLDEAQVVSWIRQASELPGWIP